MSESCELCGHDRLEAVYTPEASGRGLTVRLCGHCGLLQSLPRIDRAPRCPPTASSGADWGNIRYGKAFRTEAALAAIARNTGLDDEIDVLDVGSSRGSFSRAFLAAAPRARIVALEPDERVAESCAGLDRTELLCARIEDVALETERFDIVHSCHTIEHLAHPGRVLADHWRTLKPGGILVLDAPNVAVLANDDIVEEWFIDKHLYHFSVRTLTRLVESAGFDLVETPTDLHDRENILLVARKAGGSAPAPNADPTEVGQAERLIADYASARARNLAALTFVAAGIAELAPRRVAIWGAGRLFDSLVTHGGFPPRTLALLVDTHLRAHLPDRFGCRLADPDELRLAKPDVIVIMSRRFAQDIAEEAKRLAPQADVVFYGDLLARARLGKAA